MQAPTVATRFFSPFHLKSVRFAMVSIYPYHAVTPYFMKRIPDLCAQSKDLGANVRFSKQLETLEGIFHVAVYDLAALFEFYRALISILVKQREEADFGSPASIPLAGFRVPPALQGGMERPTTPQPPAVHFRPPAYMTPSPALDASKPELAFSADLAASSGPLSALLSLKKVGTGRKSESVAIMRPT